MLLLMRRDIVFSLMTLCWGLMRSPGNSLSPVDPVIGPAERTFRKFFAGAQKRRRAAPEKRGGSAPRGAEKRRAGGPKAARFARVEPLPQRARRVAPT